MNYPGRLAGVRRAMEADGLDAMLVSNLINVRYLCGFTGSNGYLFIMPGSTRFITDGRYRFQAADEVHEAEVQICMTHQEVIDTFIALTAEQKLGNVGYEGTHVTVVSRGAAWEPPPGLDKLGAYFGGAELVAVQGLVEHTETIDVIGEVKCWVRDLQEAWEKENDRRRNEVTRATSAAVIEFDIAAPRPTVWEHFTLPSLRPKWRGADGVRETSESGRRGVGTTNHCMHGAHTIIEEVIDWRPFDYLTLTTLLPMPGAPKVRMTYAFSDAADSASAGGGTHIEIRVAKPKPKDKAFLEQVGAEFQKTITSEVATLRRMLEGQKGAPAAVEEPALPVSAARFLTQPVNPP